MTMLQTAMKTAGIYSIEALGKSLCERYPDFNSLKARSVSVKLGLLNQGNTSWWLKRPEFVEKLTELLCCTPQDLGLHFSAKASGLYEFEDFPELPPLDLSRDAPCEIGYFAKDDDSTPEEDLKPWFGQAPFGRMARALPLGVSWLYFPRGTGKDIFWTRLTALSPFECKSALSVASMANRLKQAKPICLNVSDSSGERDLLALANRHKDCSVLVCAPFDLPKRNNSEYFEHLTWKYRKESPEGRSQLMLTNPKVAAFEGGADRYKWRLYENWRSLLLQWIERRLASHPDTLFDAKNLQNWLCSFSDQTLFDTPRSLIALCRFAHRYGHRALPFPRDQNAGKKLLDLLTDEPLEYREAYVELVKDWLSGLDLPWGGWLNGSRWREIAASADQKQTYDLLNQMVEVDDATKRMAIAQKARTQLSTSNRVNLIDSRFLLQNEEGHVMLSPRFLAELVARDWICHQILETPHTNWGTLCFDSFRRELIKEAFDLLSIKEIAECASTVIRSYREDAAGIGATEAIFAAIGLTFIWYLFPYLPTNFQTEILGRFLDHEKWVLKWLDIVMHLSDDHVDAVIPWLGVDHDFIGYMVGMWLWGRHENKAEALLVGNTSHSIKRRLILSAETHPRALPTLIQVLKSEALLSPDKLKDLVLRFLPSSAELAPELLSLMRD